MPPRNRAEGPKTIPKSVREDVRTSNNRPNLHMVGPYATAVSIRLTQGRTSLALPWRPSASGKRSCQDPAQRDSAATPRDPCPDPLCRENSPSGADWRTERQNYGAAAQRKPGMCHKCVPNVAQTWRFCSVDYTTGRTLPLGACWRVDEAAPPREGFFEFVARRRRDPESRRVCRFRYRRDCAEGPNARLNSLPDGARREGSDGGPQDAGLILLVERSDSLIQPTATFPKCIPASQTDRELGDCRGKDVVSQYLFLQQVVSGSQLE